MCDISEVRDINFSCANQVIKNGVGSRYYRSFFVRKRLDACRNVKRNESFMYQNTFITKITE
jgi:hypothetical protein